jgi:hypothetical protein
MMRLLPVAPIVLMLLVPSPALADWIVKPFAGVSIAPSHGFVDLEPAGGKSKPFVGAAVGWLETGRVTTLMGNVTWLLPHPTAAARLRVYVSGGVGVARVTIEDVLGAFSSQSALIAANAGGGVLIRLRPRLSLTADIKYFRSRYGDENRASFGEEFLAFTRLAGGAVLRF